MTDASRVENITPASRVEELAESFVARFRKGERPSIAEYTRQYPELAGQIEEIFPALLAIEQVQGDLLRVPPAIGPTVSPPALLTLGDFRILREIGRGGMGIVYEAEQISLGRRVALKILSAALLSNPQHRKRFQREARAAAQLHHTNIVPVFGVGEQDGVSYYVMQFIQGLGLDDVLKELIQQRSGVVSGATPITTGNAPAAELRATVSAGEMAGMLVSGEFQRTVLLARASGDSDSALYEGPAHAPATIRSPDLVDTHFRGFSPTGSHAQQYAFPDRASDTARSASRNAYWDSIARIGVQVAEALHYAHEQGVIHRDIKPANLLLDTRGVAWVTDFGLAKATDSQDLTHTGDVLGTLRYMAPEQFEGKSDSMSDIYALGLTLYEMLALRPAFDERDRQQLIKEVTTGTPPRLRTLEPRIPRDLETIIHKAIERDPTHRYSTAGELADDLQRYLGDEPIRARRVSLPARLRRWFRRNPAVAGLTTTIGVLLAATAAVAGYTAVRFERLAGNNQRLAGELQSALGDAEANLRLARTETARATAERERAESNVDLALKALDAVYLDAIGTEKLLGVGGAPGADREDRPTGLPVVLSNAEKALLKRGLTFYDEFAAQNSGTPLAAEQTARAYFRVGLLQRGLGELQAAVDAYRSAAERFTELSRKDPTNADYLEELGQTWRGLAKCCVDSTEARQSLLNAREAYSQAIALRPREPRLYLRRSNIAGDLVESREELRDLERVLELDPDNVTALSAAARAHLRLTEVADAIAAAERAVAVAPNDPAAHLTLAETLPVRTNVFSSFVRSPEDDREYERRIADAYATALRLSPDNPWILAERAEFHSVCGKFLLAKQDIERAQQLATDASFDRQRGEIELGLGNRMAATEAFLKDVKRHPDAWWSMHKAAGLLVNHDPPRALDLFSHAIERRPEWCTPYKHRGALRIRMGQYMAGLEDLRKSVELRPTDTSVLWWDGHPTRPGPPEFMAGLKELADIVLETCPDKVNAHAGRGQLFSMLGEDQKSAMEFENAVRINPARVEIWRVWGMTHERRGRPREAMEKYARAAELLPTLPDNWFLHARVAMHAHEFSAARDSYSALIDMRAEDYNVYEGRAAAHFRLGDFEAAIADCKQAAALKTGDPGIPISVSQRDIADCPDPTFSRELVEIMQQTLERPEVDRVMGQVHLGNLLRDMGRYEAAFETFESAAEAVGDRHAIFRLLAQSNDAANRVLANDPRQREQVLRRALKYSTSFQTAAKSDLGERLEHAYRLTRLAMFLHEEAIRPADALEHYEKALETLRELQDEPEAQHPRPNWYRRELAYFEHLLSRCHLKLGNIEDAKHYAISSATRHRELIERLPDVPDYPERLGWNEATLQLITERESAGPMRTAGDSGN